MVNGLDFTICVTRLATGEPSEGEPNTIQGVGRQIQTALGVSSSMVRSEVWVEVFGTTSGNLLKINGGPGWT